MSSIKLPPEMEQVLADYCQQKRLSKEQVVQEALATYLDDKSAATTPYELGSDLFGQVGSGQADASVSYKDRIKKALNEKYAR